MSSQHWICDIFRMQYRILHSEFYFADCLSLIEMLLTILSFDVFSCLSFVCILFCIHTMQPCSEFYVQSECNNGKKCFLYLQLFYLLPYLQFEHNIWLSIEKYWELPLFTFLSSTTEIAVERCSCGKL